MNNHKLNLIQEATTAYPSLSTNDAMYNFLRNRYSSEQGLSDLIARYLAATSVYNFDGVDDYAVLANRAINPDGDIDIEWEQGVIPTDSTRTVISQADSTTLASREFYLRWNTGKLECIIGGVGVLNTADPVSAAAGVWRITVVGNAVSVFRNKIQIFTNASRPRGAAREPTAPTRIGVRNGGALLEFFSGLLCNVKINGVLWPMADRNQTIQLPSPSGLGVEIFNNATATVSGSVTASGDFFTFNVTAGESTIIRTPSNSLTPNTDYLLELEIFDHVAGAIANNTNGFIVVGNSVGKFRQVFNTGAGTRLTLGRSGSVCNFKVRNISLKSMAVAGPTELVTNGDFSAGTASWASWSGGVMSVSGGQMTLTTAANQTSRFEQFLDLEPNCYYEVSCDVVSLTVPSTRLTMRRNAAGGYVTISSSTITSAGKNRHIFLAPATDATVQINGNDIAAGTVTVDNVSIRKLDSLCNPMTLVNTTSDRWQEIIE